MSSGATHPRGLSRISEQRIQLITVAVAVRDKTQAVGNTLRRVFRMVGDKQQLGRSLADQHVDKATDQLAIERIQPLQRFIEDQQRRVFDQCAGDQR